ncbi:MULTISPECIES: hypothetical protein [Photorhabdus]|uniref:Uncharacterized protein n=1 Tax=Photorhabdus khanii TaxID=1004150 RepID=A0A7C9KVH9_9GAMM|nr:MULTISPECIES: hypothetical protein [Photorhabdus]MQL50107.1 hypothetical protein [Photorhabdus khanii]
MTFRHRLLSEWTETRWRGSAEAGLRDCAGQVECRRRPDRQGRGAEECPDILFSSTMLPIL